jgi:hypothetical protein
MFTAILRALSLLSNLAAERRCGSENTTPVFEDVLQRRGVPDQNGSAPFADEPRNLNDLSQCHVSFNVVFRTREEPASGIAAPLAEQG